MSGSLLLFAQEAASGHVQQQYFFGLEDANQRFVVLLVVIGCVALLLLVGSIIAGATWNSIRTKQIEAELKQDMLDRGMSAEEIEQVIKAQPKEGLDHWVETWAKKKCR